MHKFLNKKLLASIMVGTSLINITNPTFALNNNFGTNSLNEESSNEGSSSDNNTSNDENSEEDDNNSEDNTDVESKLVSISDITKENEGKECTITATINSVDDNIISASDSTGSGNLYLAFSIEDLKQGDKITAKGTIKTLGEQTYLLVDSRNNLTVIKDNTSSDNNDNISSGNGNNDENNSNGSNNEKPNNNGNSNGNHTQQKPGTNNNVQLNQNNINNQNNQNPNTQPTTPTINSRAYTYIAYDLSSSQWDKIKSALEDKKIKVRDLKNNQIMIKKVSNGYGDRVWIVNDPRELDKETEESIRTIGTDLADSINYADYNVTKSKWNTIVNDVKNGNAKLKILKDETLKVIYSKTNKKDSTITLNKR